MKDLSRVTAAILAGGLGTRIRPVIGDRQKVLAEVGGRPFVTFLLDQLLAVRVKRVVLCTGYRGEEVRETLGVAYGSIHLVYSQEPFPLGTAGALRQALPFLDAETILVMNGDSFCAANLKALFAVHRLRAARATILLQEVPDSGRFGRVQTDERGAITSFREKGVDRGAGWINGGVYCLAHSFVEAIPPGEKVSLEEDVFPTWIGRGLFGFRSHGRFLDMGTPESYAAAEQFFLQEKAL